MIKTNYFLLAMFCISTTYVHPSNNPLQLNRKSALILEMKECDIRDEIIHEESDKFIKTTADFNKYPTDESSPGSTYDPPQRPTPKQMIFVTFDNSIQQREAEKREKQRRKELLEQQIHEEEEAYLARLAQEAAYVEQRKKEELQARFAQKALNIAQIGREEQPAHQAVQAAYQDKVAPRPDQLDEDEEEGEQQPAHQAAHEGEEGEQPPAHQAAQKDEEHDARLIRQESIENEKNLYAEELQKVTEQYYELTDQLYKLEEQPEENKEKIQKIEEEMQKVKSECDNVERKLNDLLDELNNLQSRGQSNYYQSTSVLVHKSYR